MGDGGGICSEKEEEKKKERESKKMWKARTGQRHELKKDMKETTRVELENKGQKLV